MSDPRKPNFMIKGVRYRRTFDNAADAKAWELQVRADLAAGRQPDLGTAARQSGPTPRTIGPFVDYVRKVHWDFRGRSSAKKLHRNAEMFAQYLGPNTAVADALTHQAIHSYLMYMKGERRNSNDTVNRHIASIKVVIRVAAENGLIKDRPAVQQLDKAEGRTRTLDPREEQALLQYLMQANRQKEADVVQFLVDVGSRLGETLKLRWEWVDLDTGRLTFPASITKAKKTRTVWATDRVLRMLNERRHRPEGSGELVFEDINYWGFGNFWARLRTRLKFMVDLNIHDLRHTCATRLAAGGMQAGHIMEWMGHKSIVTSQRYINLSVDHLECARDVLNRYGQMVAPAGLEPASR